ncbi:bifunctional DNA-formamidopyrimidine glycosylase/DNA-(apurinic or apyrimidinic site) lyase [Methanorbis rubei]|uniref:Formamidopyrimidine-DNA glycosylase n=1 Tax=Methanorbis rubei TaxID=3028300 RepID=A0AAE4SBE1_9EURY|nr:Formamidopyrimidine-DNA glycosylase [Methanocorpusculaceae archaeon Cs1]
MPELPEIETIKRVLLPQMKDATIKTLTVKRPEVIAYPTAGEFCKRLAGQKICDVNRRGKFLTVLLESGDSFTLHLRMTGCLLVTPSDYPAEKHTHIVFELDNGNEIRFSDTRRFGRFWFFQNGETDSYSGIDKLGLEPFDRRLTSEYLKDRFGTRRKSIKECLLDQSAIAGIGNIYSDEILFAAKLLPKRPANTLIIDEWQRLISKISEVLIYFIEKNAVTPEEYLQGKGQEYRNTPFLRVYGNDDKPCPICGELLCKTVIAGRSCVYCPTCQGETEGI